jgi:hypothetical protein
MATNLALLATLLAASACGGNDKPLGRDTAGMKPLAVAPTGIDADLKPGIDFTVEDDYAKKQHWLADWMVSHAYAIGAPHVMPVPDPKPNGTTCDLQLSPVLNSHTILKKKDQKSKGFVAAVISPTTAGGCPFHGKMLGPNDRILWVVRFDRQDEAAGRVYDATYGKSWLVHVDMTVGGGADEPVSGESWNLGQCGNSSADNKNDYALDAVSKTVCTVVDRLHHMPDQVAAEVSATILQYKTTQAGKLNKHDSASRILGGGDGTDLDVSLWFACGTDCCYTDTQGTVGQVKN